MFLTHDELYSLTGYKFKKKQRLWLAKSGFSFAVRANGSPIVLRAHVEQTLGLSKRPSNVQHDAEPNLDGLKQLLSSRARKN